MSKETIIGATPEQVNKNTSGRLYTVSQNATGGIDCNMYCFIKDIEQKDKNIADLEAKLAEMQNEKDNLISKYRYWKGECAELKEQLSKEQKHISRLKNMNKSHDEAVGRLTEENNQLKQQLAEKEKEAELYKQAEKKAIHIYNDEFVEKDKELKELRYKVEQVNQDKISFCIERLEKVKEILIQNADEIGEEYKEDYFMISLGNAKNIINNQINVLRNNKDGIH